jgi:paraquat-inducible protein B
MTSRPQAVRIGLFALLGLALLLAAVVAVFGARVFKPSERAVMQFTGSVYGLQLGSPVVFRGVRIGSVRSISVSAEGGRFAVPVETELDSEKLQLISGTAGDGALAALVQQGLAAQLATQSLLTGQLYVDLDLRGAGKPAERDGEGRVRIPTTLTRFQSLQEQLDRVDVNRMSADLAATLAATRGLVGGPEIKQTLNEFAQAAAALSRLSASMDKRLPGLADAARGTLRQAGEASGRVSSAADRLGSASDRVGNASDRVGSAAERAQTLLTPGSPLLQSVQQAADELGRSAAALRSATSDDSASVQSVQRAMGDVSRAARAVRELADQIEQQPQSLIRGRAATP